MTKKIFLFFMLLGGGLMGCTESTKEDHRNVNTSDTISPEVGNRNVPVGSDTGTYNQQDTTRQDRMGNTVRPADTLSMPRGTGTIPQQQ